jgi:hypothetical protein
MNGFDYLAISFICMGLFVFWAVGLAIFFRRNED